VRQNIEKIILDDVIDRIKSKTDIDTMNSIVFASDTWHPGVIGIVSSKIVDRYYMPTFLISLKDGIGKGSGRSIAGFNLYNGLKDSCSSHLLSFGGHRYAAGISIMEEHITGFANSLADAVDRDCDDGDFIRKTIIDAECALSEINYDLISQIEMLSPFGNYNPEPILATKNVKIVSLTTVGNNHLKMRLKGNGMHYDSIWFGRGEFSDRLSGSTVDVAFTPKINNWRGESNIQLKMRDIAIPGKN
jgi:single-stranded-DNA-specific exonuclease